MGAYQGEGARKQLHDGDAYQGRRHRRRADELHASSSVEWAACKSAVSWAFDAGGRGGAQGRVGDRRSTASDALDDALRTATVGSSSGHSMRLTWRGAGASGLHHDRDDGARPYPQTCFFSDWGHSLALPQVDSRFSAGAVN